MNNSTSLDCPRRRCTRRVICTGMLSILLLSQSKGPWTIPPTTLPELCHISQDTLTRPPLFRHVYLICKRSDFIITTSADGYLKFWKKTDHGIEFVKQYRSHLGKAIEETWSRGECTCDFWGSSLKTRLLMLTLKDRILL